MRTTPGGGGLHQIFGRGGPALDEKWTQWDLRFCKNDLRTVKMGVNKIENQGEH